MRDLCVPVFFNAMASSKKCLTFPASLYQSFLCRKNMILMDVIESREISPVDYMQGMPLKNNSKNLDIHRRVPVQRELSQAMIPGKHLVKVEIEKSVWESKMKNTSAYSTQATEASKSSV